MKLFNILKTLFVVLFVIGIACYTYFLNTKLNSLQREMSELQKFIYPEDTEESLLENNVLAPDFALFNQDSVLIRLEDIAPERDKLLVFTAEGCPYCDDLYPILQKLKDKHNSFPIIVIRETAKNLPSDNKSFLNEKNYNFLTLTSNEEVFTNYQISATPTTYLINSENLIEHSGYPSTIEELENWIDH